MTRKQFTPRDYQHIMIDHVIGNPRCALWVGMGMGKTAATISAFDILELVENVYPILVVAPLRVAEDTWPNEVAKWEEFKDITISAVVGEEFERKAALRRKANIYTINYENLPWLREQLGTEWPFKAIVSDESTKLKGFRLKQGGLRARALARVAHTQANRFVELTGTPSPNGLKDLWGQVWFLDAGQRLGRTFEGFRNRWFQKSFDGYSIEPLPYTQIEVQDRLKDICLSLDPADYFDLEEPIVSPVYVDLPPKARALYNDMEKKMFMELEGHEVEAFNAAARTNKCLQIANGAAYVDPLADSDKHPKAKEWKAIHDIKLQALESIVEEAAGMPVLVAYNFVSDKERLLKHFPKSVDLATRDGMAKFKQGKVTVGIGHPASIGHGVDGLQDVTNIMAIFGHDWNLEYYLQFIERIGPVRQFQSGHRRPVFIYPIIARGTMDELVMARRDSKREVQDILLEAMKHRRAA